MQHRPAATSEIDSQTRTRCSPSSPPADPHHGILSIPPETLTCITSHLSPPALLSLACACSDLAHHVRQDSTWRSAFVLRFLRVSHDDALGLDDQRALLLRRNASTWREAFVSRYLMIRRWSRSKNLPVTHTPLMQSPITAMHIVPTPSPATLSSSPTHLVHQPQAAPPALLSASTQYGIVARSFPLSGKVLPGFLDASATGARPALGPFGPAANWGVIGQANLNHFWNGNPNVHFSPDITTCALSSSGADPTANIAWGTRAGQVIFTTAPRPMDITRRANHNSNSGVRVTRCALGEEHNASVEDVRWVGLVNSLRQTDSSRSPYALSAGTDGRVKLWDATVVETGATNMCLWTSQIIVQKDRVGLFPDPCVRVEGLIKLDLEGATGHIIGVVQSGDIHVWTGFTLGSDGPALDINPGTSHLSATNVREMLIPRPTAPSFTRIQAQVNSAPRPIVKALSIDPNSSKDVVFLIAYEDEPVFYRIHIRGDEHSYEDQVEITSFGDPNFGRTSVVVPFFARNGRKEPNFVLVGDHIGCVSLYAWDAPALSSSACPIPPLRSFEAHRDGASITALWWDGLLLVTGSSRGTTHVWDGMTFEHLRSFVNPIKRVRGRHNHQGAHANGEMGREAVRHLLVTKESDVLVVGVGGVVLAWHAGPVSGKNKEKATGVRGRHAPGTAPGAHGKKRGGGAKYIGHFEMRQAILESQSILDHEAETTRRAHGREREHLAGLESLGLSEAEAVEYVLMLSRDEVYAAERQRLEAMAEATETEQGVFEGDFDDIEEEDHERSAAFQGPPSVYSSGSSVSSSSSGYGYPTTRDGRPLASVQIQPLPQTLGVAARHVSPSNSNGRVQVVSSFSHPGSHLHRAEPVEAGEEYFDYEVQAEEASRLQTERELQSESRNQHSFPPIPSVRPSPPGPSSLFPPGINFSPKSVKSDSAWSVPLVKRPSFSSASASGPSSPSTSWATGSPVARAHGFGSTRTRTSYVPPAEDDVDEDLRFALELSLVEARSRGEDV